MIGIKTAPDFRKNSLNTLKIIAALQVAYLHTVTHLSVEIPSIISRIFGFFMGVPIFFTLSGFLIWNSINSKKNGDTKKENFFSYARKRAVRIFPELWIGVAIEIILLIVFLREKLNLLILAVFTFTQSTLFQFWTPDAFRDYGCGTPNGTLWTMGVTIQFYIVVWFLYKLLNNKNIYWWISALAISFLIKAFSPMISNVLPGVVGKLYDQTILPYLWMFMIGAFIAQYKDTTIPLLKKTWWLFIGVSFVFSITNIDVGFQTYGLFTYALRVPGLIGLCYNLHMLNIKFDISYGLFIYHMIVVNLMIEFGFTGRVYHLIIAIAISIILACISTLIGKNIASALNNKRTTEIKT